MLRTENEWRRRIHEWHRELPFHFYSPLGNVEMDGFTTFDRLSVTEAAAGPFQKMPAGTCWGAKWEYGWFRGRVLLPEAAKGKRIVLRMPVGDEAAIYVNGTNAGAADNQHHEITLSMSGVPGESYEIMAEVYAGHGPRDGCCGPTAPDEETMPEPPAAQCEISTSTFGVWEEDVYQLWIDIQMLHEMAQGLDQESLRTAEIKKGLQDFTLIVDFEVTHEEMLATVRACREHLKPLFQAMNGSTAPTLYAYGHSHIDVAWLWPLRETEAKTVRTFSTQLGLMDEYPGYKFLASEPHLYRWLKEDYPELYTRVKEKVAEGRFIPEGGMWVEADTNITSGESLIRQFIHGKRFFKEEFGVESEMLWLPDVFGYTGALPQILAGCGIKYFSTAKIYWNYNGGDPFPYTTFTWKGIDGSEVLCSLTNDYNSHTNPTRVIQRWTERRQKIGLYSRLMPFGHGDGGGGPTRDHLEYLTRSADLEGLPKVKMSSPIEFFKDLEKNGYPDDRYVGELYFQAHRGVYTSQAKTKKGNRKSEFALREAEMWSVAARALAGFSIPAEELDSAWKQVLLNQFHDILPGSSIHRVYEEAEAGYAEVLETTDRIASDAKKSLGGGSGITAFNSLSWERTGLVEVDGQLTEVTVPACGWTAVAPAPAPENTISVSGAHLENDLISLKLNDTGEIESIFDKTRRMELAAGPCNSMKMYKDVPGQWDAWDIDSEYMLTPFDLPEKAQIEVVSTGPLVGSVRVTRKLHNSTLTQLISLHRNSARVDFSTTIDWHERHKLLKVNFPVNIHANEAVHEIQFGHITRPNHFSRQYDADRFEVANQKWTALVEGDRGCAVLNDCKYGVNVMGNSINLTLLKSAMTPDMTADQGVQEFTYAFYAWNGPFSDSDLVHQGYDLNVPITTAPGSFGTKSLFSVDAPNIIIETVKPAEDGTNDTVLRLYESMHKTTRCTLTTTLPMSSASITDMLEQHGNPVPVKKGTIMLEFRPFEVKTVRFSG